MTVFLPGPREVTATTVEEVGLIVHRWRPSGRPITTLVFCHGFLVHPRRYRSMLSHVASHGIDVAAPITHRASPSTLAGASTPVGEAAQLERLVGTWRSETDGIAVAGHSRGGQVAWLIGGLPGVVAVMVVDPVDGAARSTSMRIATARPAPWDVPTLVVGAATGGRCAPAGRNHDVFASAGPTRTRHLVAAMGHADMLDEPHRRLGRLLCGGATDYRRIPSAVGGLIVAHLTGAALDGCPIALKE